MTPQLFIEWVIVIFVSLLGLLSIIALAASEYIALKDYIK